MFVFHPYRILKMPLVTAIALTTLLLVPAQSLPSKELTDNEVRAAIQRAISYLKKKQNLDGSWTEHPNQAGGMTALCTLALLSAGTEKTDPTIQKAIDYLRALENPKTTYATSLQTMAFCAAFPNKDRPAIARNVAWLESTQIREGKSAGSWHYQEARPPGDGSNSQFALMALYEAQLVGVPVRDETWRLALDYWTRGQLPDGSWSYQIGNNEVRGSMVCAGIASTVIASGNLGMVEARVINDTVECCGATPAGGAAERGLVWLGNKFSANYHPGAPNGRSWQYYYLYGVERVGRLTGRRFIGEHDWFREGAQLIISQQENFEGFWEGKQIESNRLVATSFALLFLAKGRRPVVMSRLELAGDSASSVHRSAVRNLTWRLEKRWGRDLSWQTVNLRAASLTDLLESPVLFLCSNQALDLSAAERQRLKEYIEQGGFLFAEAACGDRRFDQSFRALMSELFPNSPLRLLPPDHAMWFADQPISGEHIRPLYGVDACCRTSVVYCPQNLSCFWELYGDGRDQRFSKRIKDEIESCLRIGQNVITYATNRELKEKLDRPKIASRVDGGNDSLRGVLAVPKIAFAGGGDEAPNALANLLGALSEHVDLRVDAQKRLLPPNDDTLADYPIAFMHGRRSFRFSSAERKGLVEYLQNGGVLVADSICGSEEFADSFRREIRAAFPTHELTRIPPEHPLFTAQFRGADVHRVTLRNPLARVDGEGLKTKSNQSEPLLEGLSLDGRIAVIFSPYDLSCALESGTSLECKGYSKVDAAKLGINIILFALQQ